MNSALRPIVALLCSLAWLLAASVAARAAQPPAREPLRWWKGNLHTHSLWSDGDEFPENIAEWYKTNGYHFLALSDHNIIQKGAKWITATNAARRAVVERHIARRGSAWVDQRETNGVYQVRLKTLDEFRGRVEERGRFLMIPSEEITDKFKKHEIHMNATNLRDRIKPQGGTNVLDVMQRNIDAVLEQRRRTSQPMFPHVNHPNFGWSITAEDLMRVQGEQFFEIYNGHPSVHNEGDAHRAGVERMWDIMLAFRLTQLGLGTFYGLAVDDSHSYQKFSRSNSNPGRGWVVVRAPRLEAASIVAAMEAGDFYSSSGVTLKKVERSRRGLSLEIAAEPGVEYTTQFIGTLRGFDPSSRPGTQPTNSTMPVTRIYSEDIGAVLAEVRGKRAEYKFHGDELYVRAKITSTKPKANPYAKDETEAAWVQPVFAPMADKPAPADIRR